MYKLDFIKLYLLTAWTKEDREERTSKLSYIAQWVAAAASEVHIATYNNSITTH